MPSPPTLHLHPTPYLSLATLHNHVPPLRRLALTNAGHDTHAGLTTRLTAEPAAFAPLTWPTHTLAPGQTFELDLARLEVDRALLAHRTEAETARLTAVTTAADGTELARATAEVRLLPPTHWGGYAAVPELVAAHILPNDPAVAPLLRRAAELLGEQQPPRTLDAYQSNNPHTAAVQVAAVCQAIAEADLHYVVAPSSFERVGQKVRTPTQISSEQLGNCLDVTLLAAAALEQAGLHAVVVLVEAHAYLACWLHPSPVSAGVIADAQFLRKALRNGLLLPVEATLLVGKHASVDLALRQGRETLEKSAGFEVAVDLHAARTGERISPYDVTPGAPAATSTPGAPGSASAKPATPLTQLAGLTAVPDVSLATPGDQAPAAAAPEPPATGSARVAAWKAQLLDLTRRNKLLNWRPTGGAVHLRFIDGATLEDRLASGKKLDFDVVDERRAERAEVARKLDPDHYAEAIATALGRGTLLLLDGERELLTNLIKLERGSRTALEEGGTNTLFVAIGFAVKPQPGGTADFRPRATSATRAEFTAPLILVPVELRRKRAGQRFQLVGRDEDAILNPTLQKLLADEAGVDFGDLARELPADDSGVDVPGVLQRVRQLLLGVPGWEVVDEVALGEFNFKKYLMWRDLDAFEAQLKANPVVRHLIDTPRDPYHVPRGSRDEGGEGGGGVNVQPDLPAAEHLDATFPVAEMLTPMSADSSQLAAVRAAAQGIDFVLEGPPGTGKSQTITNLIAQCLGEGKTVLFVSEKTAALEVVERRLNAIGLGEFCLELHSNKVTKTAVYDQLRQARSVSERRPSDYAAKAAELGEVRRRLNRQVEALHAAGPHGLTVYRLVAYCSVRTGMEAPGPSPAFAETLTADTLREARSIVRDLALRLSDVSTHARGPLRPIAREVDATAFAKTCGEAVAAGEQLQRGATALAAQLSLKPTTRPRDDSSPDGAFPDGPSLRALDELADLLLAAEGQDYAGIGELVDSGRARKSIAAETEATLALVAAFNALSTTYRPDVVGFDAGAASAAYRQAQGANPLWRWLLLWLRGREVKAYAEGAPADVGADLERLATVQRERRTLPADAQQRLTLEPRAVAAAERRAAFTQRLSAWAAGGHAESLGLTGQTLEQLLDDIAEERPRASEVLAEARSYRQVLAKAERASTALSQEATGSPTALYADAAAATTTTTTPPLAQRLAATAQGLLDHQRDWRPHQLFAAARERARALGLDYFTDADYAVSALDQGPEAALERFELGVRRVLAKAALRDEPLLRDFSGTAFEDLIERFADLDAAFQRATTDELRARLQQRQANIIRREFKDALGILQQELSKKRRQMPVRQLVQRMGSLLPQLTPCLLMSPLSIAQYLPADAADVRFDVVVFDEASQIPTWDAIGAIARGKQVVVVGDTKQLPPTNFFGRADGAEVDYTEEELAVEDLESILDEMKAAQLQVHDLRWHYRSRAESLIAFSNRTYYDGRLHTFPAPVATDAAVAWHKVESRGYLKGRNREEGQALVDYLVERLRKTPPTEQTFGVVTFGQAQQSLIEDMLEVARQTYPEIEPHFDAALDERLFVKNIENVQGDERAVILFSITYGPDASGRVAMRFGPMNQTGGERRLNVAVTRAREEMHLFSSMEPGDIDLKRLGPTAQGARDLRYFMEFAKNGPEAFGRQIRTVGDDGDHDSPFEQAVADALRARGYETDTQVGVSGYRIDLGVRDPQRPGYYLAGIECDGATYHATATARERDVLRQGVLEGLGWTILRVWSLDWWHDAERVVDKLVAGLEGVKESAKSGGVKSEKRAEGVADAKPDDATASPATVADLTSTGEAGDEVRGASEDTVEVVDAATSRTYTHTPAAELRPFVAQAAAASGSDEPLYDEASAGATVAMMHAILEREAPLLLGELLSRAARDGYGFGGVGSRIRAVLEPLARRAGHAVRHKDDEVVWRDAEQAGAPVAFRAPDPADDRQRGIAQIPLVELEALARELLLEGFIDDDLIKEMGRRIGLSRVSGSSRERVREAVEGVWG